MGGVIFVALIVVQNLLSRAEHKPSFSPSLRSFFQSVRPKLGSGDCTGRSYLVYVPALVQPPLLVPRLLVHRPYFKRPLLQTNRKKRNTPPSLVRKKNFVPYFLREKECEAEKVKEAKYILESLLYIMAFRFFLSIPLKNEDLVIPRLHHHYSPILTHRHTAGTAEGDGSEGDEVVVLLLCELELVLAFPPKVIEEAALAVKHPYGVAVLIRYDYLLASPSHRHTHRLDQVLHPSLRVTELPQESPVSIF